MSSAGVVALRPLCDDSILPSLSVHNQDPIMIQLAMSGSMVPMRVLESESIESVKLRIQSYKGFVVKNQKLVCGGRVLSRSNSLVRDYGVSDGNVVHLVVRLSELQMINVRSSCGKEFTFHVEKNRDVGYVKRQLGREKKGLINMDEQEILCEGEELEDERLINDICKYNSNDAVIHLFVRKSGKIRAKAIKKDFEVKKYDVGVRQVEYYGSVPKEAVNRSLWLEAVIVNPKAALPGVVLELVNSTYEGLKKGNYPIRSSEGTGGAYMMMDASGSKYVSVFKPIDEEPMAVNNPRGLPLSGDGEGLKKGTSVGEGALREVAAYILDHPKGQHNNNNNNNNNRSFSGRHNGFSGVPPTLLATCLHPGFNHKHPEGVEYKEKMGSLQMFMDNCGSCEDMGPNAFPVEEVHKISVLDIRMANADRHAGNILVTKTKGEDAKFVLIPIDHGYCLPASFEDCTFDWLYWPQAREAFSSETVEYIKSLDAEEDIALLKFYGWNLPSKCARVFRISTMLLKKGVELLKTPSPFAIGKLMCRENMNKQSVIEEMVQEAEDLLLPGSSEAAFIQTISEVMDRCLCK